MDKKILDTFQAAAEAKAKSRAETKNFAVPGVGELPFRKLNQAEQRDYIGRLTEAAQRESGGTAELLLVYREMIFDCCPTLQDKELRETLGVIDPLDVVDVLFDPSELIALAVQLTSWLGFGKEDAVKN